MAKKVIQVPVDEKLLKDLDRLSKKRGAARAEVIREACARYVHEIEEEELDRIYREGYRRIPEETSAAEAQVTITSEILEKEEW